MENYLKHILRDITLGKLEDRWARILLRGGYIIHCRVQKAEPPFLYASPAYIEYEPGFFGEAERWLMININDIMTYAPSEGIKHD